jgi:hypothetical protein
MRYLAETIIWGRMNPIGVFDSEDEAKKEVEKLAKENSVTGEAGMVTELEPGRIYADGIGVAEHWHYMLNDDTLKTGWH